MIPTRKGNGRSPVAANRQNRKSLGLFILISCFLVPAVFLLLFEGILRVCGYGYPAGFFEKQQLEGKECYISNYRFTWSYFPRPMARQSAPLAIPVQKPDGVIRVVILGSSAAMGDPDPSFSFSRMLEVMLKERYPGRKIEVYNTAITAINSNVLLPIAKDCLEIKPDLFILYDGNNEVIGPFGLSTVLTPFAKSRQLIRAQIGFSRTKTGQFFRSLVNRKPVSDEEWHGMELFLKNKVSHSNPQLATIYDHFRENLSDICKLARNKGIPIVLSSVIVNDKDCAPFVSLHNDDLYGENLEKWDTLYREGQGLDASNQWQKAIEKYREAEAIDGEYAELQFRLGHCYLQMKQTNDARICLAKARDYDALRFRTDSKMNDVVRSVAARFSGKGVYFVDSAKIAEEKNGIPGEELLYEHVHLNFAGNYLLATSVLAQAELALHLSSARPVADIDECKKALAWTTYDEKRITEEVLDRVKSPPFTGQCTSAADIKHITERIAALKASIDPAAVDNTYKLAMAADPHDWWLHYSYLKFLFPNSRYLEAFHEAEANYRLIPFEYLGIVNMGLTLQKLKRFGEAEEYYHKAIVANPYFSKAYRELASVLEEQRKFEDAETFYQKGRIGSEGLALFYNRTGVLLANERQFDVAERYFNRALVARPNFPEAEANLKNCKRLKGQGAAVATSPDAVELFNQANRFLRDGQNEEALELYRKVLAENSSFAKAHNNMAIALVRTKHYDEAVEQFTEASRLDPSFLDPYPNLAALLGMQGKHMEAIEILKKALAIKPSRELYAFIGKEYQKLGDDDEAQRWLAEAKK